MPISFLNQTKNLWGNIYKETKDIVALRWTLIFSVRVLAANVPNRIITGTVIGMLRRRRSSRATVIIKRLHEKSQQIFDGKFLDRSPAAGDQISGYLFRWLITPKEVEIGKPNWYYVSLEDGYSKSWGKQLWLLWFSKIKTQNLFCSSGC